MREISCQQITDTVSRLCQEANYFLPEDRKAALTRALEEEPSPAGREVLRQPWSRRQARKTLTTC